MGMNSMTDYIINICEPIIHDGPTEQEKWFIKKIRDNLSKPRQTGYLNKSHHKSLLSDIVEGRRINAKIEELRKLGYSDEYINKELGHLVNWRI